MEYEIYWSNLNKETQKELLELMGDNGNYDVVPIATIHVKMEQEEGQQLEHWMRFYPM